MNNSYTKFLINPQKYILSHPEISNLDDPVESWEVKYCITNEDIKSILKYDHDIPESFKEEVIGYKIYKAEFGDWFLKKYPYEGLSENFLIELKSLNSRIRSMHTPHSYFMIVKLRAKAPIAGEYDYYAERFVGQCRSICTVADSIVNIADGTEVKIIPEEELKLITLVPPLRDRNPNDFTTFKQFTIPDMFDRRMDESCTYGINFFLNFSDLKEYLFTELLSRYIVD